VTAKPFDEPERPGLFTRLWRFSRIPRIKDAITVRWRRLKARRRWVRHTAQAWQRLQENNGSQYAAAITYFSFLALFPLILLAVSITGYVLHSHPQTLQSLFDRVTANVPGQLGTTLNKSISTAIKARTSVGIIGLAGVLLTGLGWIGNLRAAVEAVWGSKPKGHNFFLARVWNLMVLAGLALGLIVSLALTAGGTALSNKLVGALALDGKPGTQTLVTVVGLALALVGDMIIFSWLLVRLPGAEVPTRVVLKGALLASVGFEVLKIAGTYTIKRSASSPTAGPFASPVAILIWIQLVARWMLFCAAWMSVLTDERVAAADVPEIVQQDVNGADVAPSPVPGPAATGATIFGVGFVSGAAFGTWLLSRLRWTGRRSVRGRTVR
jgi:membrane protein